MKYRVLQWDRLLCNYTGPIHRVAVTVIDPVDIQRDSAGTDIMLSVEQVWLIALLVISESNMSSVVFDRVDKMFFIVRVY